MTPAIRTLVTFRSAAFNTADRRPEFLNPDNFGQDVAAWLASALQERGYTVDHEIGQEDHGWYFTFSAGGDDHDFVVGYRENDGPEWIGWIERSVGLVGSLLGGRRRRIDTRAVKAIHEVLSTAERVDQVRWHEERKFTRGIEDEGSTAPDTDRRS